MGKRKLDMLEGPLGRSIFIYTVPIILTGILQLLYNAADLVVVGRFAADGVTALGAVGATSSLIHLITNMFLGLSAGTSVVLAIALGAKNDRQASRITHTSVSLAALLGVAVGLIGALGAELFLTWMKTPASLLPGATLYLRIYFLGAPGVMLYNFGAAIVRTTGDTRRPLLILASSGLVNVALNLVLVLGCGMSVAGVAIATVTSQYVSAAAVLARLFRMKGACRLSLRALGFDPQQLKRILVCGVPAGIQSSMFNIANVIIQTALNSLGDIVVAGCTAAGSIEGFIYTAINAFHQSSLTFTGQNVGARNHKRIDRILITAIWQAVLVWAALAAVCILFAEPLISLYLPEGATDAAASLAAGKERLILCSATTFICALMEAITGSSRGMGASLSPMLVSVFGICGVRLIWIFAVFYPFFSDSVFYLFLSYPISWGITVVAHVFVNRAVKRRTVSS